MINTHYSFKSSFLVSALDNSATTKHQPKTARLPVLIADDDPFIRLANGKILQALGYCVDSASSGHEALALFQKRRYGAIITDIHMPMTGIELATEIRRLETHNTILTKNPVLIIALTTDSTRDIKQQCLAAGINAVLTKPMKPSEIVSLFLSFLG